MTYRGSGAGTYRVCVAAAGSVTGGIVGSMTGTRDGGGHLLAPLQPLLDSAPAAVAYLAGRDLVYEYANEEYRQLVGRRDLLGQPYREALPELSGQGRSDQLGELLAAGQPWRGHEVEMQIRRDGALDRVIVDYACQPVRDDNGAVAGLLIFVSDVTRDVRDRRGRAALTAELAASQERFRTLFETLPYGIVHYAADGLVIGMNQAARDIARAGRSMQRSAGCRRPAGTRCTKTAPVARPSSSRSRWRCAPARWSARWCWVCHPGPASSCAGSASPRSRMRWTRRASRNGPTRCSGT